MNKMTEVEIHAVLDGIKEGDEIKTTFLEKAIRVREYAVETESRYLRFGKGSLLRNCISIENLGQPEKPKPEVESFALLQGGIVAQEFGGRWYYADGIDEHYSWNEIKPLIKILYNPDGTINEGWE